MLGPDIPGIDIVSLAKGHGCAAERITDLDVLKTRVAEGFKGDGPLVIEVPISPDIPPLI